MHIRCGRHHDHACESMHLSQSSIFLSGRSSSQVPGRRCPSCLERGDTVWVIPGKACPQCGTPVN
ncbi:hypothetical protein IQ06DRAFT_208291 [Phaeosphaeriaceae sp. SRC1lsM3a]|nr:hypothetical protein IQ06DRAFT_208291 [Stagonospora sp. SRC1lsM3a]